MRAAQTLLRHDRAVVLAGLAAVTALSWIYLLLGAGIEMDRMEMPDGTAMAMMPPPSWSPAYFALMAAMWAIMMAAMMLPGAAPTILLVTTIARKRAAAGNPVPGTVTLFTLGYLVVWSGFSLGATLLQWALDRVGLLSSEMAAISGAFAGAIAIAAGLYQWTSLKQSCLKHCRSPLDFLMQHWRDGSRGALLCGARHGLFCLGCCWMLMALLFAGGLMNVLWVAALAFLILLEKTIPWGGRLSWATGAALVAWGGGTIAAAL